MVLRSSDSRVDRLRRILLGRARGGCGSQADAVFCTGLGRRRKVKECLAQEGGAGQRRRERELGEESRVAGDRDLSRALCKDEEMHARPLAAEPGGVSGASVRR